jgi:hypothetical protein
MMKRVPMWPKMVQMYIYYYVYVRWLYKGEGVKKSGYMLKGIKE